VTVREHENLIRRYFQAWLKQDSTLLEGIFAPAVVYCESWGPEYQGYAKILYWFNEWNSRAKVLQWDIKQFIHQDLITVAEWRFHNKYNSGTEECFDGVSLFGFTSTGTIISVKEFGSKLPHYDPYADSSHAVPKDTGLWTVKS